MRTIFISLLISFVSLSSFSQIPRFDSAWVHPGAPMEGEDVYFIYTSTHPNTGCKNLFWSGLFGSDSLDLTVYHQVGMLTAICHSQDTVYLGNFAAGIYHLRAILADTSFNFHDTLFLTFEVFPFSAQTETTSIKGDLNIFPNPAKNLLIVDWPSASSGFHYELNDLTGRSLIQGQIMGFGSGIINIREEIPSGLYVMKLNQGGVNYLTRKILIQH